MKQVLKIMSEVEIESNPDCTGKTLEYIYGNSDRNKLWGWMSSHLSHVCKDGAKPIFHTQKLTLGI